jgi:Fe2+ or Zn2+ uptake regulation protein
LFTHHNLRCTRQRLALFDALRMCKNHPTADELFNMVAPDLGGMSRATVYNTLEMLCSAGLARRMPTANGCCRYDADTTEHLHVRVRETSEIRDVPVHLGEKLVQSLPRDVLSQIEHELGVRIDGVNIQFNASQNRQ